MLMTKILPLSASVGLKLPVLVSNTPEDVRAIRVDTIGVLNVTPPLADSPPLVVNSPVEFREPLALRVPVMFVVADGIFTTYPPALLLRVIPLPWETMTPPLYPMVVRAEPPPTGPVPM